MRPVATFLAAVVLLGAPRAAQPAGGYGSAEQEAYWWLDEIRQCAFDLSRATGGAVSRWPQMAVPAGSGVLPLPNAAGAIRIDGRLNEAAWKAATSFPVGPLFGPWREGPFHVQVRACRDAKKLYLAIESPRNLAELGAISRPVLFAVNGRGFRVEQDGTLAGGQGSFDGSRHVLELAVPVPKKPKPVELSFPVELVRREGGKLPSGFAALGLGRATQTVRKGASRVDLWLSPIRIQLVPADARVTAAPAEAQGRQGVTPFAWRPGAKGGKFHLTGFRYVPPLSATQAAARDIAGQAATPAAETKTSGDGAVKAPAAGGAARALFCSARALRARRHLAMLDAPLLVVKRKPYFAGHIYDDYITWRPGGGIYIIDEPAAPFAQRRVRPLIGPGTKETLGDGVYRDPEVSWDGRRILFAHKGRQDGDTSIYEIGIDGRGLHRLTDPATNCKRPAPGTYLGKGHHDVTPAYLPDGRIVFTSTRPAGRVPCFNSLVDLLHVMDADGANIRCLSVNNVNEFDPAVLPDGRVLFGRWEYVDKTALYMQSLWTIFPDGRSETALFGNNLAKPTAILDARPVPASSLVVATLTPHNGQAVGAIAVIDPARGKNNLAAITNFTPEYPVEIDQGLRIGPSDPWPLSPDNVMFANNSLGGHGIIELVDRFGRRELVYADPAISCYAPMLVKGRPRPQTIAPQGGEGPFGTFAVQDVYRGLDGVRRGDVKWLRAVEETSRVSGFPPGGRWWNQGFLISWQGTYTVKNVLGVVPVAEDGSAYFRVPAGRAVYLQALDGDGRMIRSMRTFVQAVGGTTRSCIGCHEYKYGAPPDPALRQAMRAAPAPLQPESWGSGFVDYPTQVQPILDKHCVKCHGGEKGIAGGLDLSGGWTWAFNISYETFLRRTLVGFLNCHNSSVHTARILPPRAHGSGAAPLADVLLSGHKDRIGGLVRAERDLLMAWMDGNCNYYGTWNYTRQATCDAFLGLAKPLGAAMRNAGCTKCHAPGKIGPDWVNLRTPERSRILRAPLAADGKGLGLAWCRQRKARPPAAPVTQRSQPPDVVRPARWRPPDRKGAPHVSFPSPGNPNYQAMLAIIRRARASALSRPRVDMPGANIIPGACRQIIPVPLPAALSLAASAAPDGVATLRWPRTAETIGLGFELHRGPQPDFRPGTETLLAETTLFSWQDTSPPAGRQHYALVPVSAEQHGEPVRATVVVPVVRRPAVPVAPVPRGVVFSAAFDKDAVARLIGDKAATGRLHAGAKVAGGSLNLKPGGYATFPHRDAFDIDGGITVECWVRCKTRTQMPVVLSCGAFRGRGWFLQMFQGRWRWHLGGVDCDGGKGEVGPWTHLVATFDGQRARLFQNGTEVASVPARPDTAPWPGPLIVGQYSSVNEQYQVVGQIRGVKVYRRALTAKEAKAAFPAGRP